MSKRALEITDELQAYVDEVIAMVCKRYGITHANLLARTYRKRNKWRKGTRTDPHAKPRGHTMYKFEPYSAARTDVARILRGTVYLDGYIYRAGIPKVMMDENEQYVDVKPLSFPEIGRLLGGLHHTTVMLAVKRAVKRGEPETLTWDDYTV